MQLSIQSMTLHTVPEKGRAVVHQLATITFDCSRRDAVKRAKLLMTVFGRRSNLETYACDTDKRDGTCGCYVKEPKLPFSGQRSGLNAVIERVPIIQEALRSLAVRAGIELLDIASMQSRVDAARETLGKCGFKAHHFGRVEQMRDGEYGVWINSLLPMSRSSKAPRLSVNDATAQALRCGHTGWWTPEQIEMFAETPEKSEIFHEAMKQLGLKPSEHTEGRWIRAEE